MKNKQYTALLFHSFVTLSGLMTVLMIFSVRNVWVLMNRYVDDVIPAGDNSFLVAYIIVCSLVVINILSLAYQYPKRSIERTPSIALIIYSSIVFIVYIGLFLFILPEIQSLYIEVMLIRLTKNGVIPIGATVSIASFVYLLRFRENHKVINLVFLIASVFVLFGTLIFAYMSIVGRSPSWYANRLSEIDYEYPVYNHRDSEIFDDERVINPDLTVELDTEYGGIYWVAGDLTGDDRVEIISMKYYVEFPDINRVKSFAVNDLDENRLWHWENPIGEHPDVGMGRGSSATLLVYDLENAVEKDKLLLSSDGFLYEFDGKTGNILRQANIGSEDSSDTLVIANLRGEGKKDVILKDAYHNIWAFDEDFNLLWHVTDPGDYMLSHRPAILDIDGDGKDEVISGFAILDDDGSLLTTLKTDSTKLWYGGHIDGIVPIRQNGEWFIAVTYCDALGIGLFDSDGNMLWEITGPHFEYLIGGYFFPNNPSLKDQFQVMSKVHYESSNPQLMVNQDGTVNSLFDPGGVAFAVDWTGDGYHELVMYPPTSIYSSNEKILDLNVPNNPNNAPITMRVADFIGRDEDDRNSFAYSPDGIPDIAVRIEHEGKHYLHIYLNRDGKKPTNYVYPGIGWEEAANYFTKYYEYER